MSYLYVLAAISMRLLILIIAFLLENLYSYSQQNEKSYTDAERLASEIREFKNVEGGSQPAKSETGGKKRKPGPNTAW